MNWEPHITCALTGGGDTVGKHPGVPVTPAQIAAAAEEAAAAGAAIVHVHVRDPLTGEGSHDPALFREVVERLRASDVDVVLNLTTGMGGDLFIGPGGSEDVPGEGTDFVGPEERMAHVAELLPEICSLDCGSMDMGGDGMLYVNAPQHVRAMADRIRELGVKPELEVFDLGHLRYARTLIDEGVIEHPPLVQLCLGIAWGAPATTGAMKALVDELPDGSVWTGFGIGRLEMPMVAQSLILGGNVRVGLEDNLYLSHGRLATNGELVTRAVEIIERLGGRVAGPDEVRGRLKLRSPA